MDAWRIVKANHVTTHSRERAPFAMKAAGNRREHIWSTSAPPFASRAGDARSLGGGTPFALVVPKWLSDRQTHKGLVQDPPPPSLPASRRRSSRAWTVLPACRGLVTETPAIGLRKPPVRGVGSGLGLGGTCQFDQSYSQLCNRSHLGTRRRAKTWPSFAWLENRSKILFIGQRMEHPFGRFRDWKF